MGNTAAWVKAFRLRTLPLALASIMMGTFLAAAEGKMNILTAALCAFTTVLLQVLSNLANDYGDSVHGADSVERQGPSRAVQSGAISLDAMKKGMIITAALSFATGLYLLYSVFEHTGSAVFLIFLVLGVACIAAAIKYTAGNNPYGYRGLGDISVFIFFGWIGVMGTYYLQTFQWNAGLILPASACGFFATAVLNVNNIRDIASDRLAGKISIPVRLGYEKARIYHALILIGGMLSAVGYTLGHLSSPWQWLFLLALPLILRNGLAVWKTSEPAKLDPFLKQMALSSLVFVLTFGTGLLLAR